MWIAQTTFKFNQWLVATDKQPSHTILNLIQLATNQAKIFSTNIAFSMRPQLSECTAPMGYPPRPSVWAEKAIGTSAVPGSGNEGCGSKGILCETNRRFTATNMIPCGNPDRDMSDPWRPSLFIGINTNR